MAETIAPTNGHPDSYERVGSNTTSVNIDPDVLARLKKVMVKHADNLGYQHEVVSAAVSALVARLEALDAEPSFLERALGDNPKAPKQ